MATETETITRFLPVPLTPEEFTEKAQELVRIDNEIDDLDAAQKSAAKYTKEKIGGLLSDKRELQEAIKTKQERRPVDCVFEPDFTARVLRLVRLDTGEIVEERTMTADELQGELRYPKADSGDDEPEGDTDDERDEDNEDTDAE